MAEGTNNATMHEGSFKAVVESSASGESSIHVTEHQIHQCEQLCQMQGGSDDDDVDVGRPPWKKRQQFRKV